MYSLYNQIRTYLGIMENIKKTPEYTLRAILKYKAKNLETIRQRDLEYYNKKKDDEEFKQKRREYAKKYQLKKKIEKENAKVLENEREL